MRIFERCGVFGFRSCRRNAISRASPFIHIFLHLSCALRDMLSGACMIGRGKPGGRSDPESVSGKISGQNKWLPQATSPADQSLQAHQRLLTASPSFGANPCSRQAWPAVRLVRMPPVLVHGVRCESPAGSDGWRVEKSESQHECFCPWREREFRVARHESRAVPECSNPDDGVRHRVGQYRIGMM